MASILVLSFLNQNLVIIDTMFLLGKVNSYLLLLINFLTKSWFFGRTKM
jgi:hypothetical protein